MDHSSSVSGDELTDRPPTHNPAPALSPHQPTVSLGYPTIHVGRYTLYETIGEGAFGKVKLGVNRDTNERVAVKIMDKGEIREQDLSAQVRREIHIMRFLEHKHIVRMHEVLTSNTKLYIVMELVTGGELFDRLETRGRVSETLARKYFQQLVDGVDFCHKSGVAHRDLKPENLLLDENGDIKITDFGFSSMKNADVNAGLLYTQCGTPDYCAPEIIEHPEEGYNGAKVDVWSCGIILYALLVGRLPFREEETEKLYDLILACQVSYPSFISSQAKDLLSHLLVREPAERYSLADIKHHQWFLVDYRGDDARILKKPAFYKVNHTNPRNPAGDGENAGNDSQSHMKGRDANVRRPSPSALDSAAKNSIRSEGANLKPQSSETVSASQAVNPAAHSNSDIRAAHPESSRDSISSSGSHPEIKLSHLNNNLYHTATNANATNEDLSNPDSNYVAAQTNALEHHPSSQNEQHEGSQRTLPDEERRQGNPHMVDRSDVPSTNLRNEGVYQNSARLNSDSHDMSIGRVAAMIRAREKQVTSHSSSVDPTNPPPHAVFTQVHDRPATPVSRPIGKTLGQDSSPNADEADSVSNIQSRKSRPSVESRASPPDSQQYSLSISEREELSVKSCKIDDASKKITDSDDNDDDEEEDDSVEDYQSKPVPALHLPNTERFARHQTLQSMRQTSATPDFVQRHRSDATVKGPHRVTRPSSTPLPSTNYLLPHAQPGCHAMRSSSPSPASVTGGISARVGSPYRRVLAQVASSGVQIDGRASPFNGRAVRQSESARLASSPVTTSNHSSGHAGILGNPSPSSSNQHCGSSHGMTWGAGSLYWNESGSHVRGSSDEIFQQRQVSGESSSSCPQSDNLSQRMWNIMLLWKKYGDEDLHRNPHYYQYLRKEFRSVQTGLAAIGDTDEKLAVFQQFMVTFGKSGLQDKTHGRLDDFDALDHERNGILPRRTPTDLSSEDEYGSWSPAIVYEPTRNKSDLHRRREVSDLISSMIRKCDKTYGSGLSRENSADETIDGDEFRTYSDSSQLRGMLRKLNSASDDSYLVEEIDKLLKGPEPLEPEEDQGSFATLHAHSISGSPPPSSGSVVGSGEAFIQQTRWGLPNNGDAASVRVHRSVGPSSYIPDSFGDGSPGVCTREGVSHSGLQLQRSDGRLPGDGSRPGGAASIPRHGKKQEMAASMGLDDVEYYGSDRRLVSAKLKGVLMQIKVRNQRLVENDTWFTSSQEPDLILKVLSRILGGMGGTMTLKRETKRKLKCVLPLSEDRPLHANIELVAADKGLTRIEFKRSRADRGRTDTVAFNSFFESVRELFIAEMQTWGARSPRPEATLPKRKGQKSRQSGGSAAHNYGESLQAQLHDQDEISQEQMQAQSQPLLPKKKLHRGAGHVPTTRKGVRMAPRAVSDMR